MVHDGAMRIYLAGPMRNYPQFNFASFEAATTVLREQGHHVFSPAENDIQNGFDPVLGKYDNGEPFSVRDALADDLGWICYYAEAIVVLPGWEESLGATAEVRVAKALGIPVYEYWLFREDIRKEVTV